MKNNRSSGFTLLELLVVIAIIAILGGILISQIGGGTASAQSVKCMSNMRALANAAISTAGELIQNGHHYFPPAGSFEYLTLGNLKSSQGENGKKIRQGWISRSEEGSTVSAYSENEKDCVYAITNGLIWRSLNGNRSVYTCPVHAKAVQKSGVRATWSYVMNSYFGWHRGDKKSANSFGFMRPMDAGSLSFVYEDGRTRKRAVDKVLLFAELPAYDCDGRLAEPTFDTDASGGNTACDSVLQFARGIESEYCYGDGDGESIGFNHKIGANWFANLAFADGHVAKIRLTRTADASKVKDVTRALCLGLDVSDTQSQYLYEEND